MEKDREFHLDMVSVRLVKERPVLSPVKVKDPQTAIQAVGEMLKELDREVLCVINLKTNGTPINCHIAGIGGLNRAISEPRELLKASILSNAAQVIIVHNHVSGDLTPSQYDIQMTDRMAKVCSLVGIPLVDHVIAGGDNRNYFSFREKGIVNFLPHNCYTNDLQQIQLDRVAERGGDDGRAFYGRGTSDRKER